MTVHINNKKIVDVYAGNQPIKRVYYGADLVFSRDVTITINTTPADATVAWTVDGATSTGHSITVEYGTNVSYRVTADGYWWEEGSLVALRDTTLTVDLIRSDFPKEWGRYETSFCTVACNETKTDWVYTWSLHFENGTLPIIVGKNASDVTPDLSLYAADTNTALNGACYFDNKWNNAIARDASDSFVWTDTNNVGKNAIAHPTAAAWGWNNGNKTVQTGDFRFEIIDNLLTIRKNGNVFKTFYVSV